MYLATLQILDIFGGYTPNPLCRSTPHPIFSHVTPALHASTSIPIVPTLRNDRCYRPLVDRNIYECEVKVNVAPAMLETCIVQNRPLCS